MLYSTLFVAAAAVFSNVASAQNATGQSYFIDGDGELRIDPQTVDLVERRSWCRAQRNSCPQLCGGSAMPNDCDPDTLTYNCECTEGNTPNITDFEQTIPGYVCRKWVDLCVEANPDDLSGITTCRDVTCGERNASQASTSSSSGSSSSSTSSGSSTSSTSDSDSDSDSSDSSDSSSSTTEDSDSSDSSSSDSEESSSEPSDGAAVALGFNYGTGALMGGLLALFGFAL